MEFDGQGTAARRLELNSANTNPPKSSFNLVMQSNHAVGILPRGAQLERYIPMARCDERYALPNEGRYDVNVELVNLTCVEK